MKSFLLTCSLLMVAVGLAQAQFQYQTRVQGFSRGAASESSRILSNPAVSPYLALTDLGGSGGFSAQNYFTIVKPQIESRQQQLQQQRQINSIQQSVTSMRTAPASRDRQGARITGHPTRFGNYLQYYPGLSGRR